jgi:hypothetical protein
MALQKLRRTESVDVPHGRIWSDCQKKNRYSTEQEAQTVIAHRRDRGSVEPLRYYECAFCHGFHLTKRGPR